MEKSHANRGYAKSVYGSHVAYHFMVGKDGTVIQNRALSERSGHTRNNKVNLQSIAIVVAGNFQHEQPTRQQILALRSLIKRLDAIYTFEEIIGHREASPTACPGKYLTEALGDLWRGGEWEVWSITRYYTPVRGQLTYYRDTYEQDFVVNCSGDCLVTADGHRLQEHEAFTIAACPPEIAFGTKIEIEGIGVVTCHDRGGAIKQKRLDVWAGIGTDALVKMKQYPGGLLRVRFLDQ